MEGWEETLKGSGFVKMTAQQTKPRRDKASGRASGVTRAEHATNTKARYEAKTPKSAVYDLKTRLVVRTLDDLRGDRSFNSWARTAGVSTQTACNVISTGTGEQRTLLGLAGAIEAPVDWLRHLDPLRENRLREAMDAIVALIDIADALRDLQHLSIQSVCEKEPEAKNELEELLVQAVRALESVARVGRWYPLAQLEALARLKEAVKPLAGMPGRIGELIDKADKFTSEAREEFKREEPQLAKLVVQLLSAKGA